MRGYTISEVMGWGPCRNYPRKRLEELFAGRSELTALDVFKLPVPDEDKLWALLHTLPDRELRILACKFAKRVAHLAGPEAAEAIRVKRLWIDGKASDEELCVAETAAWGDAETAAEFAALGAAWAAAWAAAQDDAWATAWYAAGAAAGSAAWAAARSAEFSAQLAMVREVLERLEREENAA